MFGCHLRCLPFVPFAPCFGFSKVLAAESRGAIEPADDADMGVEQTAAPRKENKNRLHDVMGIGIGNLPPGGRVDQIDVPVDHLVQGFGIRLHRRRRGFSLDDARAIRHTSNNVQREQIRPKMFLRQLHQTTAVPTCHAPGLVPMNASGLLPVCCS